MAASIEFALCTHAGLVRPLNEDAIGLDPALGLAVLADGLGGYNAGEVASTMAVSCVLTQLTDDLATARAAGTELDVARAMSQRLVEMNSTIFRAATSSSAYEGMATTIVLAWLLEGRLWIAHAGDSRAYRFRDGVLEQLTRDHSFSQELLDAGMVTEEEARMLPAKNLVTRALGAAADLEPEVHEHPVQPNDWLMLCSDGLTEMVSHAEIGAALFAALPDSQRAAQRLVDLANAAGGRDNTSVLLLRALPDGASA
ncbi:MAG: PP2C family protein-serine/threonine phosphatase [Gemmatimonas sp.]